MRKHFASFVFLCASAALLVGCNKGEQTSSSTPSGTNPDETSAIDSDSLTRAEVYETTGSRSKLLQRTSDLELEPYSFTSGTEVNISAGTGKDLIGYGAAMTQSSAYLLMTAEEEVRNQIIDTFFVDGGFSVLRVPLGTSDYTLDSEDFYTYDDYEQGADYTLAHFSIEKDLRYLIPAIKEVQNRCPDVTIFAAPWSAPAWMKTSNSLIGGYLKGYDETDLAKASAEEKAYADYLFKTVAAFDEAGVTIDYLSLVNEPFITNVKYPSMQMSAEGYFRVAKALCQKLEGSDYSDLRLDVYDHNVGDGMDISFELFVEYLLDDELTNKYVSGFALHCYDGNWPTIYGDFLYNYTDPTAYPDYAAKDFYITEVTESSSSVDFAQNLAWAAGNVTIGPMGYGASACMYWNLVLTSDGKPVKGNSATCFGVISLDGDEYKLNPAYYALAHVAKFAKAEDGEKPEILSTTSSNEGTVRATSYENPNGEIVVALVNINDRSSEDVSVVIGEEMVTLSIEPQSVTTLVFKTGEAETFTYIEYDHVDIYQTGVGQYRFEITLDAAYSDPTFYLSFDDSFAESAKAEAILKDGVYVLEAEVEPGEFYLNVTSGDLTGGLNITIPSLAPSIEVLEGEGYYVEASFNLDTATSWSSFCDPNGKKIYRSASDVFDDSAEQVNVDVDGKQDNIYITTNEYVDKKADEAKPNYFFVLEGKAGKVTFISSSVTFRENVFAEESLSLELIDEKPYLVYRAKGLTSDAPYSALRVKDVNGETHQAQMADPKDDIEIRLDLTSLEKTGTWYDVLVTRGNGSGSYEFRQEDCLDYGAKVECNGRRYEFQNWEGIVKVNAVNI